MTAALIGLRLVIGLLKAAGESAGTVLTEPVVLDGSNRSTVLRCRSSAGGTVVLKAYPDTAAGADRFATEAAGLTLAARTGLGPELLGAQASARLIVMSDLGPVPSMADLLLGGSRGDAESALLDWVKSCGTLALLTASGQRDLARLRAGYLRGTGYSPAVEDDSERNWLERRVLAIPRLLGELGIDVPAGLSGDLEDIVNVLRSGRREVFSPGDICPDNNLFTADGMRFIDFESAGFQSVFLDAAYLRMPFSSCWCVFRLPEDLADRAEASYRNAVCQIFPDLANDEFWHHGMRKAMAAWTLHAMTYLLDRSLLSDGSMNARAAAAPTARQLLRYRWRRLHTEIDCAGEFPAMRVLLERLLADTEDWLVPDLPLYPAFR